MGGWEGLRKEKAREGRASERRRRAFGRGAIESEDIERPTEWREMLERWNKGGASAYP